MVYLVSTMAIGSLSIYGADIIYMNPEFDCQGQADILEVDACSQLELCDISNTYTLTARLGLYCGAKANDRNLIQSMTGLGGLVGVLLVSIVGSKLGKKVTSPISMVMGCLHAYSLLLGGTVKNATILMVSQLLAGGSYLMLYSTSLLLL